VDFTRVVVGLRGAVSTSGWDYDVVATHSRTLGRYTIEAFVADRLALSLNVVATRYRTQAGKLFEEVALGDVNGTLNNPKWTGTLAGHYDVKGWRFHYGLDWIDGMSSYERRREDPAISTFKLSVPSYISHTVAAGYKAEKWDVTAGVRNLAALEPPLISALTGYSRVGNAPLYCGYDDVGRSFYLNLSRSI
jgi:iron complex outermembrane recepter protein